MNVGKLRKAIERMSDKDEILVWSREHEVINGTYELTIDTDMRTGKTVIVICAEDTEHGNLRDYEPHPGFEDHNQWQWEGTVKPK